MPFYVAAAAAVVAAGVSAYGSVQAANAQAAAAKYNSQVDANNAAIQQQNAARASAVGEQQAAVKEQETRAKVGGILTEEAASGIDVNSGSAVDVRSSASELGQLDAMTIKANAAQQAYGFQVEGMNETAKSQLDAFSAKNDESAGQIKAAGTLISSLGSAAGNYANASDQ